MKRLRNISWIIIVASMFIGITSCEQDTDQRKIKYAIRGLTSEYKVTYNANGVDYSEIKQGGNFLYEFKADKGEVLYFDIKYKDDKNKMSPFSALITVNGEILEESYAYDMKWADSATQNIPYPFEILLRGTVPY